MLHKIFNQNGISPEDLQKVIGAFERMEVKKNDFLIREGQTIHEYYLVESGLIRSYAIDTEGNDITTGFYPKASIIMEVASFFLRIPTKENIQVLQDSVVWKLNFETFQNFFHSIEAFRETGRARLVQGFVRYKQKSISMITDSAKDRYKFLMQQNPMLLNQAPLKHVATYLGVTDTSLSRIRKEIAQEK